jgi:PhnB protein
METKLNPYIHFNDKTRQAMEFYQSVFGGKLTLGTFKEFQGSQDPSDDNKIMHAQLEAENGITLMASDTPSYMGKPKEESNIDISLSGDNEAELTRYYEKLSQGGTVTQPLVKATWGDSFGMCIDQFGVTWLVNISAPKP